jgi:hypothetical protein
MFKSNYDRIERRMESYTKDTPTSHFHIRGWGLNRTMIGVKVDSSLQYNDAILSLNRTILGLNTLPFIR